MSLLHTIQLGVDNCYVLQGQGEALIMIDGGTPKQGRAFEMAMARLSLRPNQVRLIVLTHGHWDHIGSAAAIKAITGAKIAMHERERDWLEQSLTPLPPGVTTWGRAFVTIMKVFMPLVHVQATKVDIVLGDEGMSLEEYGVSGRVICTPGHSMGSVSVLLETGDAFVGDLAMNSLPLRRRPGLPILAEDMEQVKELAAASRSGRADHLSRSRPGLPRGGHPQGSHRRVGAAPAPTVVHQPGRPYHRVVDWLEGARWPRTRSR
jgi:glyoxylase-like metal-dependent hydrolase (beta-lactamase superfamily II)